MALVYETNLQDLDGTGTIWVDDPASIGESVNIIGLSYGATLIAGGTLANIYNTENAPSNILSSTTEFKIKFNDPTIGANDKIWFYYNSHDGIYVIIVDAYNKVIQTIDRIGIIYDLYSLYNADTTNGDTFKIIIDNLGMAFVYLNGIYISKSTVGDGGSAVQKIGIQCYSENSYFISLKIYDQVINPPDNLPDVSVSNGTLYFTEKEVRNAGRFRNNVVIPVEVGDTTYISNDMIENIYSLMRVSKSTGAITQLSPVKSSPATGEYSFTKPNVFVFGDTATSDMVFYAEVERMVFLNEIEDVRAEVQAEIDGILASKFSNVPLPSNSIYQQVRKKGAELAAIKIMMRHQDLIGKEMRGLQERYDNIMSSLAEANTFSLNGQVVSVDKTKTIRLSPWQNGHYEAKELRRSYRRWG